MVTNGIISTDKRKVKLPAKKVEEGKEGDGAEVQKEGEEKPAEVKEKAKEEKPTEEPTKEEAKKE